METFKKGEKIDKYVINSFIKKGMVSSELGKFYSQLFELRQTGDYDDWKVVTENDIAPLMPTADVFLDTLEDLIRKDGYMDN